MSRFTLLLGAAVLCALAPAALGVKPGGDPEVFTEDGHLKLDVAAGKRIVASVGGVETDILAKIAGLKARIARLQDRYTPESIQQLSNKKVVTTSWKLSDMPGQGALDATTNEGFQMVPLGLVSPAAVLTVDVSTQGCGMNAGQSFSINARNKGVENGGVSFEVFKKGHVNNLIADNVEVVFNQPADPDVSAAYWLYVKVGSRPFCDASSEIKATITVDSSIPLPTPTGTDPGKFKARPADEVVNMEELFGEVSNLAFTKSYDDVPVTMETRGADNYRINDDTLYIGVFKSTQVVKLDIEDTGCAANIGLSYTVVARDNLAQKWGAPKSFHFGALAKYQGGASDRYSLIERSTGNDLNEGVEYHLWLQIKGESIGQACTTPSHDVKIVVQTSSRPKLQPVNEPAKTGQSTPVAVSHMSMEDVADTVQQFFPKSNEISYQANAPDTEDIHVEQYLGRMRSEQSLKLTMENRGCQQHMGVQFRVVGETGRVDRADSDHPLRDGPKAYIFGSASGDKNEVENFKLRWKPISAGTRGSFREYDVWAVVVPSKQACGSEPKTHTLIWQVQSPSPLAMPDDATVYDAADATIQDMPLVSLEDVALLLDNDPATAPKVHDGQLYKDLLQTFQDSIRASAGIDSKVEVEYDCEWNPGAAVVPQSKFLGVFHAADVIHIDASDVGWGANVGMYLNIVGRDGLTTSNTAAGRVCGPDREACAPEVFMLGTTAPDSIRDGINMYWKVFTDPTTNVEVAGKYSLFLGIVPPRVCQVPYATRQAAGYTPEKEGAAWADGKDFKHTVKLTIRRVLARGPPSPEIQDTDLDLKATVDGTVSMAAGFEKLRRYSAEDIVTAANQIGPEPARTYGVRTNFAYDSDAVDADPKIEKNVLPYELTLQEYPELFRRSFDLKYGVNKEGVKWPDPLPQGMVKYGEGTPYPNLDKHFGFVYLGRYGSEQVFDIEVEDRATWNFGNHFTCLSANHYAGDQENKYGESAGNRHVPTCFALGSGAWRQDGVDVTCGFPYGKTAESCSACGNTEAACQGPAEGSAQYVEASATDQRSDCSWSWRESGVCTDSPWAQPNDPAPFHFVYRRTGTPGKKCGSGECQDADWWMVVGHRPVSRNTGRSIKVVVQASSGDDSSKASFVHDSFEQWGIAEQKANLALLNEALDEQKNAAGYDRVKECKQVPKPTGCETDGTNWGQGLAATTTFESSVRGSNGICSLFDAAKTKFPQLRQVCEVY